MQRRLPYNRRSWQRNTGKFVFLLSLVALVYIIFLAGYLVGRGGAPATNKNERVVNTEAGKPKEVDFSVYWEAWNKLQSKAATTIEAEKMIQGSIAGLLSAAGDPYTVYFKPEDNKRFREDISGEFSGIGVEIIQKNSLPTVVAPLAGSPAESAGMKPNDIILEVDGAKTNEISFDETVAKIRGEKGTTVKLKVLHENTSDPVEIQIKRDTIVVKSVQLEMKENSGKKIAYLKVTQFAENTPALFADAVKEIKQQEPNGIIIDLRNNPGGYLDGAVDLSSYFIDGVVVSEKGKDSKSKEYRAVRHSKLEGYRVAILVNGGSASASEIFGGALQDRGVAKLVGEKTFGKGSVQELVDLSDGSAIKVTIANWYTPNGRQITSQGIEPDIKVENNADSKDDAQLGRAEQYIVEGN